MSCTIHRALDEATKKQSDKPKVEKTEKKELVPAGR